jgi:hypothetical protein
MERGKTLFCLPDSPDIFVQCSTALTPNQTPCFDLKTQMTPFLSHVIVFLVNNSLQNAKEKFEVKDLVRCLWKTDYCLPPLMSSTILLATAAG